MVQSVCMLRINAGREDTYGGGSLPGGLGGELLTGGLACGERETVSIESGEGSEGAVVNAPPVDLRAVCCGR